MNFRKGVSPVIASVILIGIGLFLALSISDLFRETAFSQARIEAIEYSYIYCTTNTSINQAKWKVVFHVINRGTQSVHLKEVFVNEKKVEIFGLVNGDSLDRGNLIGTSLPVDGLNLMAGEGANVYVWVGDQLFSSGTTIIINLNTINSDTNKKFIQLT
ncbi:hypothetical protein ACFL0D_00545 [Thermoproteota archaeon]